MAETLLVKILGRQVIEAWEGVQLADGSGPAPVTPEAVNELLDLPAMAVAFLRQATEPIAALVAEGNGSGVAPNGTMAAAPTTARGAGTTGWPAPAASA
ncbi:MAG: hypothetical protein U1E53_16195 [Dongiaceae bacterium]